MTARSIEVTLGSGATPLFSASAYFNQMVVANKSTNSAFNFGDSTVSATKGIPVSPGGSINIGPFTGSQADASGFYAYGTNGNVIEILLV